jgi:molecular chaperone GrpE
MNDASSQARGEKSPGSPKSTVSPSSRQPGAESNPAAHDDSAPERRAPERQAPDEAGTAASETERLRAELTAAEDRALRSQAELDNFRKRIRRDTEQDLRYATMPLLQDVLNVRDNLIRAIEAAEQNPSASGLLEGVKMVSAQLDDVLRRHHCQRIEAEGEAFDPHRHEAIAQQPSGDCPPNTVLREVRSGYSLHDRVVRPAQVLVSTAPTGEGPPIG